MRHPGHVERLVVSEAPLRACLRHRRSLGLAPLLNERLWHPAFNQLPEVNEQLVTGPEEVLFGAEFYASAGKSKLSDDAVSYYIDTLAFDPKHDEARGGRRADRGHSRLGDTGSPNRHPRSCWRR
jgi:hypothetical protein